MLNINKIFLSVFVIASLGVAGSADATWPSSVKQETCFAHSGISAMTSPTGMTFALDGDAGDQLGINFYLARERSDNGAKFCPTHVMAWRKNLNGSNSHPSLEKWNYSQWGEDECFWVCHEGYFGDKCKDLSTKNTPKSCATDTIELVSGENLNKVGNDSKYTAVSDGVWTRTWDENCKKTDKAAHKEAKHAETWAVKRVTKDGFGVVVQRLQFWAYCKQSTKQEKCRVRVRPVGEEMVMCQNGYTVTTDKQSCKPIDVRACGQAVVCDGWDIFDDADPQYKRYLADGDDCYKYRCAESGYGFAGTAVLSLAENRKCIECPTTYKQGISADGVCEVAEAGEIFSNGEVATATATNSSEMLQCWNADDFKACLITGATDTTTNVEKGSVVSPIISTPVLGGAGLPKKDILLDPGKQIIKEPINKITL